MFRGVRYAVVLTVCVDEVIQKESLSFTDTEFILYSVLYRHIKWYTYYISYPYFFDIIMFSL